MAKATSGDAYKQKRGDLRHYAEAVEVCLNAKEDDIIHIENYGDISTLTSSIEVKDLSSSITLGSYQIWNTLKNWTTDFQKFNQFDKLILLTTSPIVTDSRISDWNKQSKEYKYKALLEVAKNLRKRENASPEKIALIDKVSKFSKQYTETDLLDILNRFHICISNVDSKSKYQELTELEVFKFHSKRISTTIIDRVISFIFKKGLEGDDRWVINISELHRLIRKIGGNTKKKLPKISKQVDKLELKDYKGTNFVKELNKIDLETSDVEEAIADYCQAQDIIIDLLEENSLYADELENYKRGELLKYLKANKRLQNLESGEVISNSQKNYFNCLWKMSLIDLELIENAPFFQRGNIHSIVDDGKHKWLLNEN